MISYTTSSAASPFTEAVVSSMRRLYPEALADKSFDNTGLLLEAPFDSLRRQMNSVLLTVDLTQAVASEAIENKHCCVVAYHPIIFRGLKSLTLADSQQSSLLRLALEGISVYCPHTAVDAVPGGMTDWLCDIVTGTPPEKTTSVSKAESIPQETAQPPDGESNSQSQTKNPQQNSDLQPKSEDDVFNDDVALPRSAIKSSTKRPHMKRSYSKPVYPQSSSNQNSNSNNPLTTYLPHTRTVLHPSPMSSISSIPSPSSYSQDNTGFGRLLTFPHTEPQHLTHLIERIAFGVGTPKGFPVAIPQDQQVEDIMIRTVGVCPGSGAGVLKDCGADLIFTGELAHHDALAVTERGGCVVGLFHSNSERGFLHAVMRGRLEGLLKEEWARVRAQYLERGDKEGEDGDGDGDRAVVNEELEDALADESVNVEVSRVDRDPYGIVVLEGSQVEGMKI
ncbi:hypothetical protein EPUS_05313 [Endocarpon pusillum Z07020]|uniref:YbgI/family dinuclear metal center protein n=1 Tax=Endocarpon pusillum (strain Z07020 / HMAS-L-300199) TaxID=1263415 RepID=U1GHI3_ENDPU|nr:uncharacterized protein EPUS_05313 [Endocarpon pusillum Z07020]ERF71261.1 hypothetical protein EPUS_05313 [Endocarpon pusillum Z07020]